MEVEKGLRVCKKCLIREVAGQEQLYETLQRYLDDLEPEKRTTQGEHDRRLSVCGKCENLINAMCKACGCYVELRAARMDGECPYEKW